MNISFGTEEGRDLALRMRGQYHGSAKISMEGTLHAHITDPMEVVAVHTGTWSEHWGVNEPFKVAEVIESLQFVLREAKSGTAQRKQFIPQQVRDAAASFQNDTAIGVDNWSFRDIASMPDVILHTLAELLSRVQFDAIPPLQMLTNVMATLPKKDGGVRTVAIASTIYRLLMKLDGLEASDF